jgi:hypothetical protein
VTEALERLEDAPAQIFLLDIGLPEKLRASTIIW